MGSPEHHELMRDALWAKFTQNPKARQALLATEGMYLVHQLPRNSVTIPCRVFAAMLMDIRSKLADD